MRSCLALARKELKAQKVMAVLLFAAVMLSAMMTTVVGRSLGILQMMRQEQAASLNGDRYASFHQLTEEQMEILKSDIRLTEVGGLVTVGSLPLENSGLTLYLREYEGDALNAYPSICQVKEGRLPVTLDELALPEDVLQYLHADIQVGDTLTLSAKTSLLDGSMPEYACTVDYTVCGILKSSYIGYSTGIVEAIVGEGTAAAHLPEAYQRYSVDFKTRSKEAFQQTVDDLARTLSLEDTYIQYNWILLDALGIFYDEAGNSETDTDTGFSFMAAAGGMVGALVLLAAGLVIYNILKITVTKQIREYGMLRAIGGERRQVYCLVAFQVLLLCGCGIPMGMLIGSLSARAILLAAIGALNPELFGVNSIGELSETLQHVHSGGAVPLLVSAVVTLLFAMLAAFPAARYASRVSPTVAMTGQEVRIRRHRRKQKNIRCFEAYYARLNLKRGGGRTLLTLLSLVMSITVFVALQSFASLLDAGNRVKNLHLGDYAVTNETLGISPEATAQLENQDAVETLARSCLSVYVQEEDGSLPVKPDVTLQSWESFQIAAVEDARLLKLAEQGREALSGREREELLEGRSCLIKNPIEFSYEGQTAASTSLEAGEQLTIDGRMLQIAGLLDDPITINNEGFVNGVQVVVNEETYAELTGKDGYDEVYPTLQDGADAEAFEEWLDEWCAENPGSHWLSYRESDAQLEESFAQIRMLCWGVILLVGLIGVLNIIHTVYSNLHTRIAEIGMQRATGMSVASLYKTFLWEGAYYGILASGIGGALGYGCTLIIHAAQAEVLELAAVPVVPILEAAGISVAVCLLATAIPLGAIARLQIVEAMDFGE